MWMRRGLMLLGVVLTLGCTSQPGPPQQQIDVVAIRSELLAIGKAEGNYLVAHSTYATIDQLQQDSLLTGGADRRGYVFTMVVNGSEGFAVTATPSDPSKKGWPTLAMDQTRQVTER
jgi:hypothetical protein